MKSFKLKIKIENKKVNKKIQIKNIKIKFIINKNN